MISGIGSSKKFSEIELSEFWPRDVRTVEKTERDPLDSSLLDSIGSTHFWYIDSASTTSTPSIVCSYSRRCVPLSADLDTDLLLGY